MYCLFSTGSSCFWNPYFAVCIFLHSYSDPGDHLSRRNQKRVLGIGKVPLLLKFYLGGGGGGGGGRGGGGGGGGVGVRLGSRPMASHIICETLFTDLFRALSMVQNWWNVTKCENITLLVEPSLLAPRRWGRFAGETSALQRQKCSTDDVNHCLHN